MLQLRQDWAYREELPETEKGTRQSEAIGGIGKLEGPADIEALAGRLRKASRVMEIPLEDRLDPKEDKRALKDASLLTIGEALLFYSAVLGLPQTNVTVRALLDCGASHTFISSAVANRLDGLAVRRHDEPLAVGMPDGNELYTNTSIRIPMTLSSWRGNVEAWILELPGYEFILGRDFLRSQNPQIDWVTSVMKLRDRSKTHRIDPLPESDDQASAETKLNLMSARQTMKALRKRDAEGTVFVLRQAEKGSECALPSHKDETIGRILKRFPDVFRDSLPDALPPERATSHEINTGDAAPVNINSYPMSDEKLREQMRQVELLLQKGLIRPSASGWGFPVIFVKKANGT